MFACHSPRPRVAGGGFANPSLGHCGHAEVDVENDVAVTLLLTEVRARHSGMLPALVETRALVTGAAEHYALRAVQQPPRLVAGGDSVRRQQRVDFVVQGLMGATCQDGLREDPVDGQQCGVAPFPVLGEALGRPVNRFVQSGRLVHVHRHAQHRTAQQRQARIQCRDLCCQELVRRE